MMSAVVSLIPRPNLLILRIMSTVRMMMMISIVVWLALAMSVPAPSSGA